MKKTSVLSILLVLLTCLSSCGNPPYTQSSLQSEDTSLSLPIEKETEEPPSEDSYNLFVHNAFREKIENLEPRSYTDLTTEQMLEEWDFFYQSLEDNYPYFGVVKRTTGVDMQSAYEKVRAEIPNFTSDTEYLLAVYDFIQSTGNAGHFSLAWRSMDDKPQSPLHQEVERSMTEAIDAYWEMAGESPSDPNLTTEILEEGNIAYAKIRSFGWDEMQQDKDVLLDFYRKVQDYDHLIFDITGNGGGSMGYYIDLILAPLLEKTTFNFNYVFLKDGALNREHLNKRGDEIADWYEITTSPSEFAKDFLKKVEQHVDGDTLKIVSDTLDSLVWPPTDMNQEDFKHLDRYQLSAMGFEPGMTVEGEGVEPIPFKGKIWLLVDGEVYSSSESFAVFCKQTGFATIVGTQTGGDGIGIDPVEFPLPHSGLSIRYAPVYGTTIDGRSNEEYGTTPDFVSVDGESPLDTCLKVIKQKN